VYHVDLTTAKWMSNPDYQIRQNDVILVTPNKLKSSSGRTIKDPLQVIRFDNCFSIVFII
jgi:polysaccharide export outer membrane protein